MDEESSDHEFNSNQFQTAKKAIVDQNVGDFIEVLSKMKTVNMKDQNDGDNTYVFKQISQ